MLTPDTLQILDRLVQYSLWAYIIFFCAILFYIAVWMPGHRQGWMIRSAFHALLLSAAFTLVVFLVLAWTPLPFLENFASMTLRPVAPLRVTALTHERFHEGFSVEGEVWNQSREPMQELKARFTIWGTEGQVLEEVGVPVLPQPLAAGSAGTFSLTYSQNSPFLYGYEVSFATRDELVVPHIKGFDVH